MRVKARLTLLLASVTFDSPHPRVIGVVTERKQELLFFLTSIALGVTIFKHVQLLVYSSKKKKKKISVVQQ